MTNKFNFLSEFEKLVGLLPPTTIISLFRIFIVCHQEPLIALLILNYWRW